MTGDASLHHLMIELVTESAMEDKAAFIKYVYKRLDEELDSQVEAYELVGLFAAFAGMVVRAWAEDTDREPHAALRAIAVDLYTDDDM